MCVEDVDSRHRFKRELSQLIQKYAGGLPEAACADVLGEFHDDLCRGSIQPSVTMSGGEDPYHVAVRYSTAMGLERHLDSYLQIGGVCLEMTPAPPPLADVVLSIAGDGLDESVTLRGRALRDTPEGVAFQVDLPDAAAAEQLRAMPDRLRELARKAGRRRAISEAAVEPRIEAAARADAPRGDVNAAARCAPSGPLELSGEPERSWNLDESSIHEILLKVDGRPGISVLDIDMGERCAQIVLEDHNLLDVELYPTVAHERLEALLAAADKLSPDQIARARRHMERHGVAMAEALIDLNIMSHSSIAVALKTRARFLLGRIWKARGGRAGLYLLDELPRRFLAPATPLAFHLFKRMRDNFSAREASWIEERTQFFRGHLITRTLQPDCDVEKLDLRPKEMRLYSRVLDTDRPLSEIVRISQMSEADVVALLEALRRLGLLDLLEANPWTRRRTEFVAQLTRMKVRLQTKNRFEMLGVHWTVYDEELERAYEQRLASLEGDSLPEGLDEDALALVEQLRESLSEAYDFLADAKRRASYRDEIVDDFDKKSALQMFEKQADTAKLRRDLGGAIDAYRRVLEIDRRHQRAKQDIAVLEKLLAAEKSSKI